MSRLAVIGAGVAGLAAAWSLRTVPAEVTVYEKSRGFGGRAATRGRYGVRYDHGANFFRPSSERVERLVHEELPTDDLVAIDRPVYTFDETGAVAEPDREGGEGRKWTYRQGISTLGKLLARESPAVVQRETRIVRLERRKERWTVASDDGESFGPFDAVLLTPPAPQTADILRTSRFDAALQETLVGGLEAADYNAQFTVVLAYDRAIRRPGGCYGLVNDDGGHPLAWIGFEHDKPGHVPDGASVLVVQTAPAWTARHLEGDPDNVMPDAKTMAASVLDTDLRRPSWYDTQRWRYSHPASPADADALAGGRKAGLFFAGDFVAGKGRVGRALETGLAAGRRIRRNFKS
jgi:hypothetical protein